MKRFSIPFFLVIMGLALSATAEPGVPNLLDVQGHLRTQGGQPVNKTVTLDIGLYTAASGGNKLFSESLPLVAVTGGRFSVQLGASKPLPQDLFTANAQVFVGVSVDGAAELPRQQLVTVPYAYKAQFAATAGSAESASGLDCTGCVVGSAVADGAITSAKIGISCDTGQVLKRTGGGWACGKDEDTKYSGSDFARSGQACDAGSMVTGVAADGGLVCGKVNSTEYTAGTGLTLAQGQFSLDLDLVDLRFVNTGEAGAIDTAMVADGAITGAKIGEPCAPGEILKKGNDGWACGKDEGLVYSGADFALSDQTCPPGFVMAGVNAEGKALCQLDDAGTAYLAGTGLKLDKDTFSVDEAVILGWARAACYDTAQEVLDVVAGAGFMKKTDRLDQTAMPANGLDEVSNGLIYNQFLDETQSSNTPVAIPDNNPIGVSDELTFPDIGLAEKLTLSVDITSSNINQIRVFAYDPDNVEYLLYDRASSGPTLKTSYPDPTATVSGDLASWVGRNPKGKWRLKVIDTSFLNNKDDGTVNSWSVAIQTLSTKKIRVAGDAFIDGTLSVTSATTVGGDLTVKGKLLGPAGLKVEGDATITGSATITGKLLAKGGAEVTGNLAVSGSIALGNDTVACDGTKKGTLRYGTNGLEVCDGTYWIAALPKPVIWSGGCSTHGSSSGWNTYCTDRTEFNTAGDYLAPTTGGTFTVKIPGYYRVNMWTISLGSNYAYMLLYVNGTYRHHGHEYVHGAWSDNVMDLLWPMNKGDTFYISVYNPGSYAYHSWNAQGAHSRLQIQYMGPIQ